MTGTSTPGVMHSRYHQLGHRRRTGGERILEALAYFHVKDPVKDPTRIRSADARTKAMKEDQLYKVLTIIESVREKSKALYNLHQQVSIDEAMT